MLSSGHPINSSIFINLKTKQMEVNKKYVSIMDIVPKQVKNTIGSCICDKCKNTFKPKETLMESVNNIQFQGLLGVK